MKFIDYYSNMTPDQRRDFASRVGTSPVYLFHVARGYRYPNGRLALRIINATGGIVPAAPESFGPPSDKPQAAT